MDEAVRSAISTLESNVNMEHLQLGGPRGMFDVGVMRRLGNSFLDLKILVLGGLCVNDEIMSIIASSFTQLMVLKLHHPAFSDTGLLAFSRHSSLEHLAIFIEASRMLTCNGIVKTLAYMPKLKKFEFYSSEHNKDRHGDKYVNLPERIHMWQPDLDIILSSTAADELGTP